uniref:NADH-ubiquinone oxidoreductase chain 4L n=1 Tax=Alleculinae sp. ENSP01 TaxID=1205808 RepID=A0A0S2MPN5_9CUCU|nr:NADH deshydrogenase subunit 4L [Alleculinae sp. ENSP01]
MIIFSVLSFLMFMGGLLSFSVKRKHLISMLLSLEFIVVSVYLMFFFFHMTGSDYFFSMIFLTFSVCEGVLGLSVLVSMVRTHGNDYFQSFNVLW